MNVLYRAVTVGLAMLLVAPAMGQSPASPAPAADNPLFPAIAAYNRAVSARWRVAVVQAEPGAAWDPASHTVPDWLGRSGLTEPTLRALVAAIGVLGPVPERREPERGPSPGQVLAEWVGAIALDDARDRRRRVSPNNTLASERPLLDPSPRPRSAPAPDRNADFHAVLLALDTCAGAFFGAVARLNQDHPGSSLSAFARETATTAFPGPVPASADCRSER